MKIGDQVRFSDEAYAVNPILTRKKGIITTIGKNRHGKNLYYVRWGSNLETSIWPCKEDQLVLMGFSASQIVGPPKMPLI